MKFFSSSSLRLAVIALVAGLLGACDSLSSLQERFAADPNLTENSTEVEKSQQSDRTDKPSVSLPEDFPAEIPQLPEAQLVTVNETDGTTSWKTSERGDNIASFYEDKLESNNWEIIKSFAESEDDSDRSIIASREDLEITISIASDRFNRATNFAIAYRRNNSIANSPTNRSQESQNNNSTDSVVTNNSNNISNSTNTSYTDLDKVPNQLQPYVKEVIALGAIDSSSSKTSSVLFEPNKAITRREFARWLVRANNAIYSHRSSQEIRLATSTQQPLFRDIPTNDPDFPYIQGLAQAGIVPSALTGDTTQILFRPDATLTREDFITWRVPLDIRRSLPSASIEAVRETWGFEDTARIDAKALRSLYADFQNGENSNVRRVFGYTVLFQPKKPVTRAEAVASFWYFGFQGDGVSAEEALRIKN